MSSLGAILIAAVAACPASSLDNDWDLLDRSIVCDQVGYHECNAKIESELLSRTESVSRLDADTLHFRIGSGNEFVLRNPESESYHFWGQQKPNQLIRIQLYEAVWFGLLRADTGRLTRVGGLPHLSPTRRWMAAARPTHPGSSRNAIDIWQQDDDGYVRFFTEYFGLPLSAGPDFGRPLLRWESDDVLRICWGYSDGREPTRTVGFARLHEAQWEAEHVAE